jgi:hypothetical protein
MRCSIPIFQTEVSVANVQILSDAAETLFQPHKGELMNHLSHAETVASVVGAAFTILAFIAVVIAAVMSWKSAKKQEELQLEVARKMELQLEVSRNQIIAPMRQAWMNKLREKISSFIGRSLELRGNSTAMKPIDSTKLRELSEIKEEIILLLNDGESDHDAIAQEVVAISEAIGRAGDDQRALGNAHARLRAMTQKVLKQEQEGTKKMGLFRRIYG